MSSPNLNKDLRSDTQQLHRHHQDYDLVDNDGKSNNSQLISSGSKLNYGDVPSELEGQSFPLTAHDALASPSDNFEEVQLTPEEADRRALQDVKAAFLFYKTHSLNSFVRHRLRAIDALSDAHRALISEAGVIDKILRVEKAIRANDTFLQTILAVNGGLVTDVAGAGSSHSSCGEDVIPRDLIRQFFAERRQRGLSPAREHHLDKLRSTLRQFVRDWSAEGQAERQQTYTPLLDELDSQFGHFSMSDRAKINVLIPGAGLGRLSFEIASRGYSCQGNEFSYFMLLSSNFILNFPSKPNEFSLYPFIHTFSNAISADAQLRPAHVPDVLPSSLLRKHQSEADFSMVAGDFIEVYGQPDQAGKWDAVVTCFFMDTAKNPVDYLDTLWNALRPGGVWINLGPLLWHFENMPGEQSIELTRDEFFGIATTRGFKFDHSKFRPTISLSYTADPQNMLEYRYKCFLSVAYRP